MRKKYATDAKAFAIITGIGALLWFFTILGSPNPLRASLYIIGFLVAFFTIFTKGYYLTLDGKILKNVKGLLRQKINVDTITNISAQSAYKVLKGSIKSLYIFYRNEKSNTKYTEIRIGTYKIATLKNLINDLKKLNPKIEIDSEVQKLMEKTKQK